MTLKSITVAVAAALLASAAWAQSSSDTSTTTDVSSSPSAPSSSSADPSSSSGATAASSTENIPNQCLEMTGAERDACARQYGSTGSSDTSTEDKGASATGKSERPSGSSSTTQ